MGDLSPHFSASEFIDRRTGHRYGPAQELLDVLERCRAAIGRPLVIVSGHRCCSSNQTVGGAAESRHIAGDAADLPPRTVTVRQAEAAGAVGIGIRAGFAVHVDTRPGPKARWTY